jgi:Skp family chaperone for outer membrane proteins
MKTKVAVLSCLMCVAILLAGYEYSRAEPKAEKPALKIGVVSIRRIFEECKRNAKYKEEALAEQDKLSAEMEKLSKEIDAEKAGLKTLKAGSNDHLAMVKSILEKQAKLEAQREFNNQQMGLKDQRWTETFFKDVLEKTSEVAKQKELDLVFEKEEISFPASSANELMLTIRTFKLLYSGNCLDITDDVIAKLDAEDSAKRKAKN